MRIRSLPFTLLLFFLLTGCQEEEKGCPAQTELGSFALESESLAFVPYDTNDTLVYRNELGEETRFFHAFEGLPTLLNHTVGDLPCRANAGETTEVRLSAEVLERWYVALNGLQIRFYLRVLPLIPGPGETAETIGDWKDYYDVFTCQVFRRSIGVEELDESCTFSVVTSYRQGPPVAESWRWVNDHRLMSEVTVGGQVYSQAYGSSDCQTFPDLYYTKEQGVVSFRDTDGQLWLLDRVE